MGKVKKLPIQKWNYYWYTNNPHSGIAWNGQRDFISGIAWTCSGSQCHWRSCKKYRLGVRILEYLWMIPVFSCLLTFFLILCIVTIWSFGY